MRKKLTPEQWREKHARCAFCKYIKFNNVPAGIYCADYYSCTVKSKIIGNPDLPRPFCRCYEVKNDKE